MLINNVTHQRETLPESGHRNPREHGSAALRKNHGRQKNRRMINKNPEKKKWEPQNADFGR